MKNSTILLLLLFVTVSCDFFSNDPGLPVNENLWVNGYLEASQHIPETAATDSGILRADEIDWNAITHLTYLSLKIAPDGTPAESLEPDSNSVFNSNRLNSIVSAARSNDTKILFSVGGEDNYEDFSVAMADTNRAQFINTLVSIMTDYGFDGINLDMDPAETEDYSTYSRFVTDLNSTLESLGSTPDNRILLTATVTETTTLSSFYAGLQAYFDQLNILSVNLARPLEGWQAWHNSALANKDASFETDPSRRFPSINDQVSETISAGIDRSKIGIAINFSGTIWNGVNLLEKWPIWPIQDLSIYRVAPYSELFQTYDLANARWDSNSRVPYLNMGTPRTFVSFDNEKSIAEKIEYAKTNRLGGVIAWELGSGFLPDQSPKNPLLQAIKEQF